jgi:hypothetical protein
MLLCKNSNISKVKQIVTSQLEYILKDKDHHYERMTTRIT